MKTIVAMTLMFGISSTSFAFNESIDPDEYYDGIESQSERLVYSSFDENLYADGTFPTVKPGTIRDDNQICHIAPEEPHYQEGTFPAHA